MRRLAAILAIVAVGPALAGDKQAMKLCDPTSTRCAPISDGVGGPALAIDIIRSGISLGGGAGGGTSSLYGVAFPLTGTAAGFTDGANMRAGFVFDLDTGAGVQHVVGLSLRFSANGGSVEAGTAANPLRVDPTGGTAQPVTGTFWQGTQPISAVALPLPSGASQEHATAGSPASSRLSDGSGFYDATKTGQLPAALDGSGFLKCHEQGTATVSGSVTSNAGTNLNTSALALDATLTGGTQKAIARGGARGATAAADVTGTAQGADHQAIDSTVYGSGGNALAVDSSGRAGVQNPPNMDVASSTRAAASQLPTALDSNGYLASHEQGVAFVRSVAPPLNPFLQRCNAVRRSNCQP